MAARRVLALQPWCLVVGCVWLALVHATSPQPAPLKRVYTLSASTITILPRHIRFPDHASSRGAALRRRELYSPPARELRHDDSLVLRFALPVEQLHDDRAGSDNVTLFLRPTEDFIHPAAVVHYHSAPDPVTGQTVITSEPLLRETVRAYSGYVVDSAEDNVDQWWAEELASVVRPPTLHLDDERVRGWARIVVHNTDGMEYDDDASEMIWEGALTLDGSVWTVKTLDNYERTRTSEDADAERWPLHPEGGLVAFTEHSDQVEPNGHSEETIPESCNHDHLSWNVDPEHAVYDMARNVSLANSFAPMLPASSGYTLLDTMFGLPSVRRPRSYGTSHQLQRRQSGGDIGGNVTSNFIDSIGSSTGCPATAKVVFMGVAADCTYTTHYTDAARAKSQILTIVNSASALYASTFNVRLGVVELQVMNETCPTSVDKATPWNVGCPEGGPSGLDLNSRLSVFSKWRGEKGASDGAGLWHLMTNCSSGSEVGVAWLGQLCQTDSQESSNGQFTSGAGVTSATTSEWQVFAHEVGHNFGAIHDCAAGCSLTGSCCPLSQSSCNSNAEFIMSPVSSKNVTDFSPCSIGNVCSVIGSVLNTSCLADPGKRTVISLRQCGNGIVEPGEDCDPGSSNSTCCDPTTCKFTANSVCDPTSSSCCLSSCQFAPATTVCRPAVTAECDMAETCTGTDAACPTDATVKDGKDCGASGSGLSCSGGLCTSRDSQCQQQGSSMGITKGCSAAGPATCSLACADPTSSNRCLILTGNFVDGTECGYGGRCRQGSCKQGSVVEVAKSWYRQNPQIAIPVTIVAGILAVMILVSLVRCCCGSRGRKSAPSSAYANGPSLQQQQPAPRHGYSQGATALRNGSPPQFPQTQPPPVYLAGGPPSEMLSRSDIGGGQPNMYPAPPTHPSNAGWVDPSRYNGPSYRH